MTLRISHLIAFKSPFHNKYNKPSLLRTISINYRLTAVCVQLSTLPRERERKKRALDMFCAFVKANCGQEMRQELWSTFSPIYIEWRAMDWMCEYYSICWHSLKHTTSFATIIAKSISRRKWNCFVDDERITFAFAFATLSISFLFRVCHWSQLMWIISYQF